MRFGCIRKQHAFSLIELLLVLSIMSVVLLLVGRFVFKTGDSFLLDRASDILLQSLELARDSAESRGTPTKLVVLCDSAFSEQSCRRIGVIALEEGEWRQVGPFLMLPKGVILIPPIELDWVTCEDALDLQNSPICVSEKLDFEGRGQRSCFTVVFSEDGGSQLVLESSFLGEDLDPLNRFFALFLRCGFLKGSGSGGLEIILKSHRFRRVVCSLNGGFYVSEG